MNKKLLVLGAVLVIVIVGLFINSEVNAKDREKKVNSFNDNANVNSNANKNYFGCEYPNPGEGCSYINLTPAPECGRTLVCQ